MAGRGTGDDASGEDCEEPVNPRFGGEASNSSDDELAQAAYRHSGEGYADGKPRPSLKEIQQAMKRTPQKIKGQNAWRLDDGNVRVIINEDAPWRSTAFYRW